MVRRSEPTPDLDNLKRRWAEAEANVEHDEEATMTVSEIAAALTGERMMAKRTGCGREQLSPDEIARLAYHLYDAWEAEWPGCRRLAVRRARTGAALSVAGS